jgi:hypothetical protein
MKLLVDGKRTLLAAAVVLFLGLGLSGCDDRLERYRNPDVQIAKGATWAWKPAPAQRKVLSRDDIRGDRRRDREDPDMLAENGKVRGKIRVAIETELSKKGLKQIDNPEAADFLVDYRAGIRRENVPVERVYGGGYPGLVCGPFGCWESWGYGPAYVSYENVQIREGTIVFRFIQRGSGEVAYRALGEHRANREYFEQKHIDEAVQRLLHDLKPGQYEANRHHHHRNRDHNEDHNRDD